MPVEVTANAPSAPLVAPIIPVKEISPVPVDMVRLRAVLVKLSIVELKTSAVLLVVIARAPPASVTGPVIVKVAVPVAVKSPLKLIPPVLCKVSASGVE